VPGFNAIIDQVKAVKLLATLVQKSAVPHALLFTGIDGVGKRTAARVLAMACNCLMGRTDVPADDRAPADVPCGRCRSCRKIESGTHPDIISVQPINSIIRIAQVRQLCDTLALKPYEARQRVVIMSDAQALNPEAGNALLKILEEPPDRTLLILTARQTSDLLPTIVSRCQHIRFGPVSTANLKKLLIESKGLEENTAAVIAQLANGSVTKAFRLHRDNWTARRNWLLNELVTLVSQPINLKLAWAAQLSRNKTQLDDSLEVLKVWLRDLIVFRYSPEKIINKDLTDKVQYASQGVDIKALLAKIEAIGEAQKKIEANTNIRLTLETLVLQLTEVPGAGTEIAAP
jgi:DNA polymerase-3 subunit delta'